MSLHWKNQESTLFILIAAKREMHQSKKSQRKTLVQAIYFKDKPKGTQQNVLSGHAKDTNTQC